MKYSKISSKTLSIITKAIVILFAPYLINTGCIKKEKEKELLTLSVSETLLSFTVSGGQQEFTINSNVDWTIHLDFIDWFTVSQSTGSNNGTITVTVNPNLSTYMRSDFITIISDSEGVENQHVTVWQEGINLIEPEMIFVQGGTFTMGCTSEQGDDCDDYELPAHQVTLSNFYIGKFEVTQAQWRSVMGDNPANFKGDNYPVEQVSWNNIQEFIYKINLVSGKQYRLPTEAEWEYAARGGNSGSSFKYSGSNIVGNVAWYDDNSDNRTHTVGGKSPNQLGIYDMSGNVWELCSDWYDDYNSNPQNNPIGPSSGDFRVCRGGGWNNSAGGMRVSNRSYSYLDSRNNQTGFRLAQSSN